MSNYPIPRLRIDAVAKVDGALLDVSRDQIAGIVQNNGLQPDHIGALDPIGIKQFVSSVAKMKEISGHESSAARGGSPMVSQPPKPEESFGDSTAIHGHSHFAKT